jgi:hypothetical protein
MSACQIAPLRIIKGAPYGLNETTLDTLEKWKCKPVELGGKLVPAVFPVEMNFHN